MLPVGVSVSNLPTRHGIQGYAKFQLQRPNTKQHPRFQATRPMPLPRTLQVSGSTTAPSVRFWFRFRTSHRTLRAAYRVRHTDTAARARSGGGHLQRGSLSPSAKEHGHDEERPRSCEAHLPPVGARPGTRACRHLTCCCSCANNLLASPVTCESDASSGGKGTDAQQ